MDEVAAWQAKFRAEKGNSFVYLSDEFYLRAGSEIPAEEFYDGYPQLENGIGLVRSFLTDWQEASGCEGLTPIPGMDGDPVVAVSGTAFAPVLSGLLQPLSPAVRVEAVVNDFFGPSVNVSGLLTGRDIAAHIRSLAVQPQLIVLPATTLRKNERVFLDGMTADELERELGVPVRIAAGAAELRSILAGGLSR